MVLIISDTLLIWASASKNKLLLWPWIILHCLEWLFFIAMLIYLMVIVPKTGFQVVVRSVRVSKDVVMSLLRNKGFMLDEMPLRNASKFVIVYIYENPK